MNLSAILDRLDAITPRLLTGNISGAISTYAALGEAGPEVERRTLARLNLNTPNIGWQARVTAFSEYASGGGADQRHAGQNWQRTLQPDAHRN
ncbi:adenylosuccinate lyase [Klebsiella michiganensis]|uniref:Adenylosuccinate lyase n=1 Tax=Klebsiella michiganensis TaxID=1134687 RepID=A0A7H4PJP1_9ENTR|nr:adenylosuccinate lyase [Klebsiella michiganensis]